MTPFGVTGRRWAAYLRCPNREPSGWAICKGNRLLTCGGVDEVLSTLRGWNPVHGVLAARPGSDRFVSPISIDELRVTLRTRLRRSQQVGIWMMIVFSVVSVGVATLVSTRASVAFATACVLGALLHAIDYRSLREDRAVNERTLFFHHLWFGARGKFSVMLCAAFCLVIGGMQAALQYGMNGLEPMVVRFGAYYPEISAGEWWRILTGPYFHSGAPHFIANCFGLMFAGPMLTLVVGPRVAVSTLLLGASAGLLAAFVVDGPGYDSYLGMSGGVFSLLGFMAAAGTLNKRLLPRGLSVMFFWLALIGGVAAEAVPTTSTIGHVAGFVIGAILAAILGACRWRGANRQP